MSKPIPCRFNGDWLCTAYWVDDGRNTVDEGTCGLCLKAKEIAQAARVLEAAMVVPGQLTESIRKMSGCLDRVEKALTRLEQGECKP